jgi:poly-gamma-glutamate synthesis protein (capsule biosynthesis protein)
MKKTIIISLFLVVAVSAFIFWEENREARIIFVGDMFFDRQIRKIMYEKGNDHPFSCISDFLKSADLVVGNLEGPITENASKSLFSVVGSHDNFIFTFPTVTAKLLADNNVKVVSIGNNHIGNFGKEGIKSTKQFLDDAGVGYFGGLSGDEEILREHIGGYDISFVAYNEFGGQSADKVSEIIKEEKGNERKVVVFAHWGEEYIDPPQRVKNAAKKFADAGADIIVGAHPHVILEDEIISGVPVYYSLGNFIFDQYWNEEVSTGLALEVLIKGDEMEIVEHKVSIQRDGRTCLKY